MDARNFEGGRHTRALLEQTLALCEAALSPEWVAIYFGGSRATARCVAAVGAHAANKLGNTLRQEPDPRGAIAVRIGSQTRTKGYLQCAVPTTPTGSNKRGRQVLTLLAEQLDASIERVDTLKHERHRSKQDVLTGLGNLRALRADLGRRIRAANRSGTDLALLFVDVDRLKRINSRLGHLAGSEALARTGRILRKLAGSDHSAYRFGGDEFVILCPRMATREASSLAEAIREAVAQGTPGPLELGGELPKITVSVGIATLHKMRGPEARKAKDAGARLLAAADRALFRAKRAGRNKTRA